MPKQPASELAVYRHNKAARGYSLPPGRPATEVPKDAAERILLLAAKGYSLHGIASKLGTNRRTLYEWLKADDRLQTALDTGRAEEERKLHNALFSAAMKGNVIAAIYLTKARFGWREGEQSESASRVQISFAMPGALKPEQFTIEANKDERRTPDVSVPETRLKRS